MPKLSQHASAKTTKAIMVGDSGAGKTGSLCSLAAAGYNLRIIDLDNGLDALRKLIIDQPTKYGGAESLDRIDYETITDPMKKMGQRLVPAKATVWQRTSDLLMHWKMPEREIGGEKIPAYDLGPVYTWGPKDVLVIDSLSFLANAAMDYIMALNGRLGTGRAEQSDWFQAQQLLESLCKMLYDESVRCNVLVMTHIAYIGAEGGVQRGYPNTLGKALSPKIGRYFNSVLLVQSSGTGERLKRVIKTNSSGIIELKNISPVSIKPEYPQDTGLAQIFRDAQDAPAAQG